MVFLLLLPQLISFLTIFERILFRFVETVSETVHAPDSDQQLQSLENVLLGVFRFLANTLDPDSALKSADDTLVRPVQVVKVFKNTIGR